MAGAHRIFCDRCGHDLLSAVSITEERTVTATASIAGESLRTGRFELDDNHIKADQITLTCPECNAQDDQLGYHQYNIILDMYRSYDTIGEALNNLLDG